MFFFTKILPKITLVFLFFTCCCNKSNQNNNSSQEEMNSDFDISKLESIQMIPESVKDINTINKIEYKGSNAIISGWAFNIGEHAKDIKHYIILSNEREILKANTESVKMTHVTKHFESTKLDLDNSGFKAIIDMKMLNYPVYNVSILIVNKSNNSSSVISSGKQIDNYHISNVSCVDLIKPSENLVRNIGITSDEENFYISGFTFPKTGITTNKNEIYVVLKSASNCLKIKAKPVYRKDLEGHNDRANSGYYVKVKKTSLTQKEYSVALLYIDTELNIEEFSYTPKKIILD